MEKIINSIKRALLKVLPQNRELNGDAFQRGRQSLAIEIADIIDPVSDENLKPINDVNDGDVLYKQKFLARSMVRDFGFNMRYVLGFQDESDSITLGSVPWEDAFDGCQYEISVRKIGRAQMPNDVEEKKKLDEEAKPRVRRKAEQNNDIFFDFYVNYARAANLNAEQQNALHDNINVDI